MLKLFHAAHYNLKINKSEIISLDSLIESEARYLRKDTSGKFARKLGKSLMLKDLLLGFRKFKSSMMYKEKF